MSELRAIRDALIHEFRASGSYNRTAIWQGIGRVMDRAIEAETAAVDPDTLARALHATEHPAVHDCRVGLNMEPRPEWAGRRKCELDAERLLAEVEWLRAEAGKP